MSGIDPVHFRQALGSFVTGVTIVTARGEDGEPVGLTVNSFNSVSLDPPLVLWSLSLKSGSLPAFRDAPAWAVHVLAAGQEDLSSHFARPGRNKFAGISCDDGPEGAPRIAGYAARFGCRSAFEYEGGDHAIFVGHVEQLDVNEAEPLIYHGGDYGRVARQPGDEDEPWARLAARGLIRGKPTNWSLTDEGRALLDDIAATLPDHPAADLDRAAAGDLGQLLSAWLEGDRSDKAADV